MAPLFMNLGKALICTVELQRVAAQLAGGVGVRLEITLSSTVGLRLRRPEVELQPAFFLELP